MNWPNTTNIKGKKEAEKHFAYQSIPWQEKGEYQLQWTQHEEERGYVGQIHEPESHIWDVSHQQFLAYRYNLQRNHKFRLSKIKDQNKNKITITRKYDSRI